MKHMYEVIKKESELIVRESGELDKEIYTLLCEEKHDLDRVLQALDDGLDSLISVLRSANFSPTRFAAEKLALAVAEVCRSEENGIEFVLDDTEVLSDDGRHAELLEELEEAGEDEGDDLGLSSLFG